MAGFRRSLVVVAVATVAAAAGAAVARSAGNVETLRVGDTFTATGRAGTLPGAVRHAVGRVVVRGRWNHGAWTVVTSTRTDSSGRYRFVLKPRRHGTLQLLIAPPDGYAQHFTLRVL